MIYDYIYIIQWLYVYIYTLLDMHEHVYIYTYVYTDCRQSTKQALIPVGFHKASMECNGTNVTSATVANQEENWPDVRAAFDRRLGSHGSRAL